MNDEVKRKQKRMRDICRDIIGKAERMLDDIKDVEDPDDLTVIEQGFGLIEEWSREGYDVVLNTYDEFEEKPE